MADAWEHKDLEHKELESKDLESKDLELDDSWFDDEGRLVLRSYSLRYVLTVALASQARPMTVADLVEQLQRRNMSVVGRPSKTISDALRSEVNIGRVERVGWGRYQPAAATAVPASTMRRIRARVRYLEARAAHGGSRRAA